jgi:ligand-binding SRPBCC domain-containing protein
MKMYNIKRAQILPISLQEAWKFFSDPGNLATITPGDLQLKILYASGEGETYEGQIIRYQLKVLPLITSEWVTEIKNVNAPISFVDEQRFGPYTFWHHQHRFSECPEGVEVTDEVNYAMPFGILGDVVHKLFVQRELNSLFSYRSDKLVELFKK